MISVLIKLYPIIPIILLIVTISLILKCKNKVNRHDECTGTIVDFYENTAEARLGSYEHKAISPIIRYTVDGKSYEFIGKYYSTTMKVGNEVNVIYDKDDISKAAIKTGLYFAPIITGVLTFLFMLPVIIYVVTISKMPLSI